jgi:hypothetical protein
LQRRVHGSAAIGAEDGGHIVAEAKKAAIVQPVVPRHGTSHESASRHFQRGDMSLVRLPRPGEHFGPHGIFDKARLYLHKLIVD